jgi:general secretion pathway protein L
MSVLIIQIPPRRRLGTRDAGGEDAGSAGSNARTEYAWVRTNEGISINSKGRAVAALLPQADAAVAVLGDTDVSWQRVVVPKAPASRLRAALAGVIEEALLDEPEALHLALEPEATAGAPAWVAVTDRAWLDNEIQTIERGGTLIDRIVPTLWPGEVPHGHFFNAASEGAAPQAAIAMADSNGIVCLPLAGTLARAMLPASAAQGVRWSALPAVADAAERWLGAPVSVQSEGERLLQSARSHWNLRQFELTPHRRGTHALRDAAKRFMSPGWRPVRTGLVALALLQLVGLNAWAWSQRKAVESKRQAQVAVLKEAFPEVRAVLDAPVQMARETDALRSAAGQAGDGDLEPMLAAASAAWPDSQGPVQSMRYQTGQLTLATGGWSDNDVKQFSERLRPGGWGVEQVPGRVTITRSGAGAARNPS